jgi:hypothetical protein
MRDSRPAARATVAAQGPGHALRGPRQARPKRVLRRAKRHPRQSAHRTRPGRDAVAGASPTPRAPAAGHRPRDGSTRVPPRTRPPRWSGCKRRSPMRRRHRFARHAVSARPGHRQDRLVHDGWAPAPVRSNQPPGHTFAATPKRRGVARHRACLLWPHRLRSHPAGLRLACDRHPSVRQQRARGRPLPATTAHRAPTTSATLDPLRSHYVRCAPCDRYPAAAGRVRAGRPRARVRRRDVRPTGDGEAGRPTAGTPPARRGIASCCPAVRQGGTASRVADGRP